MQPIDVRGVKVWPALLDIDAQSALVAAMRDVVREAPLITPVTPRGQDMSVRMTAAGRLGWISDRQGYRYVPQHPAGGNWPPIPQAVLDLWRMLARADHGIDYGRHRDPDCCLVNWYGPGARTGLHQDRDEGDVSWPVLSISLGDEALFRIGGTTRSAKTTSIWLRSGDVVLLGGAARLCYHGIDRVRHGSSRLLPQSGRINLTCRVVAT